MSLLNQTLTSEKGNFHCETIADSPIVDFSRLEARTLEQQKYAQLLTFVELKSKYNDDIDQILNAV